jgi:hypothetical protein
MSEDKDLYAQLLAAMCDETKFASEIAIAKRQGRTFDYLERAHRNLRSTMIRLSQEIENSKGGAA